MGVKTDSTPPDPLKPSCPFGFLTMTLRSTLSLLLAASALTLGAGCTSQKTTSPVDGSRVALSAADSVPSSPLVLASGDTLGLELHLAETH